MTGKDRGQQRVICTRYVRLIMRQAITQWLQRDRISHWSGYGPGTSLWSGYGLDMSTTGTSPLVLAPPLSRLPRPARRRNRVRFERGQFPWNCVISDVWAAPCAPALRTLAAMTASSRHLALTGPSLALMTRAGACSTGPRCPNEPPLAPPRSAPVRPGQERLVRRPASDRRQINSYPIRLMMSPGRRYHQMIMDFALL